MKIEIDNPKALYNALFVACDVLSMTTEEPDSSAYEVLATFGDKVRELMEEKHNGLE